MQVGHFGTDRIPAVFGLVLHLSAYSVDGTFMREGAHPLGTRLKLNPQRASPPFSGLLVGQYNFFFF